MVGFIISDGLAWSPSKCESSQRGLAVPSRLVVSICLSADAKARIPSLISSEFKFDICLVEFDT
jgi:hypothetical protein